MLEIDLYKKENENFENYFKRINGILPNWPEEVVKEWLHRHNNQIDDYIFLGFDKFKFYLEKWSTKEIVEKIDSYKMTNLIDPLGTQILDIPYSFLQKYIHKNGTWPSPIIILKTETNMIIKDGYILGNPYHLLEGHLRLGYIRTLFKNNCKVNNNHLVYIVEK